ncbi:MAG: NAD(P)-dependent alcohol dehydrogenase [Chloroflexota bacterium]|nr:NAD(P)-dependent alcohol dehydrogenase [Chloroflexota bacterium]MDE2897907.1 NAD(P)-dependent alcohol dehydrogenase [Chloroflexota bacterium]
MKAAYLESALQVRTHDVPLPDPGPGEVLIRIRSVGVCASDVHYYEHGRIGRYVVREPLILGHEPAGEVVALGSGVDSLAEGDRVSIEPGVPCRACVHCRTGHYNLCDDVVFMATPPVHGAFVEFVAHPADFAYRIPDHVSYDEAALIEPLSVGHFAARRGQARLGDRAAILGAGPIGLMTLLALQSQGIHDVTLVDVEPFRLDKALELGAADAIDASAEDVGQTRAARFDLVFETAGNSTTLTQTTRIARRGGRVVLVGMTDADLTPIDTNELVDKALDIAGVFRYANTWPLAVDLLSRGAVDLKPLITGHYPLEAAGQALESARTRKDANIKVMVTP